jgi:hypothetical protein
MRKSVYTKVLLFVAVILLMSSCAPGNAKFVEETAGFWMGLWHGFISFFTFIISLFNENVTIYEINNNGNWYNFGFIFGVSMFFGGGCKSTCRKK